MIHNGIVTVYIIAVNFRKAKFVFNKDGNFCSGGENIILAWNRKIEEVTG